MQIFIKTSAGSYPLDKDRSTTVTVSAGTLTIDVEPSTTIEETKSRIADRANLPKDYQRLSFEGRLLEDQKALAFYNIKAQSTLDLIIRKTR